jgi:hypothetical protein
MMSNVLTAEDLLSTLEAMRNERYDSILMWVKEIKESSDLKRVQMFVPGLERSVFQCEMLDSLLHDLYLGFKHASECKRD